MFKFLIIFIFQILLLRINYTKAQALCSSPFICRKNEVCRVQNRIPITHSGDIIEYPMIDFEELVEIVNTNLINNNVKYIDGRYADGVFTLFTTNEFKKYSMQEKQTEVVLKATFKCNSGSSFFYLIYVNINDENYYDPKFSQSVYETKVSLPFIQGVECIFERKIYAIDLDLKYHKIEFSSDNPYLEISTAPETEENGHKSFALIKVKRPITEIDENFEIEIKAKDNGIPPREDTAKLILITDKQNSLPLQPRFQKAFYDGVLVKSTELTTAILEQITYNEKITFDITGDDSKYFEFLQNENQIKIQLKDDNGIDDEAIKNKLFLAFRLEAKHPELQTSGQTAIVIGIPRDDNNNNLVYFEKNIYRGNITDNKQLNIDGIKLLDNNENNNYVFEFEKLMEDEELFELKIGDDKNELKLILKENAFWDDDKSYLYLSIVAKMDDNIKASTIVLIDLLMIKEDFRFEKAVFEGKINQTNQLENLEIKFINLENLNEIDLILRGDGEDFQNFDINKNVDDNIIKIILKNSELPLAWSKKKYLIFEIEARKHNFDAIFSGILINLPTKLQIPQFTEIIYKGKIISKTEIEVPEISIEIALGVPQFKLSGHNSFNIDHTNGIIKLFLKNPLTDDDLQSDYIILTLEAMFNQFDGSKSFTSILLKTPSSSSGNTTKPDNRPEFENIYYKGEIDDDLQFKMEKISFKNDFILKKFYLVGDISNKYFIVDKLENMDLIVGLKQALTPDDVKGKKYFEFLLTVESVENLSNSVLISVDLPFKCDDTTCPPCISTIEPPTTTTSTTTSTTIQPPDENTPQFEKDLYRFSIKSDSIGQFGEVRALIKGEPSNEINYSFGYIDDQLKSKLALKDSGGLTITAIVPPGIYEFEVLAKLNDDSDKFGKTFVVIDVSPTRVCSDLNSQVENSLLIKNLTEEQPHYGILKATEGNCYYKILSSIPDDKDYLIHNTTTNEFDLISIDREAIIFSGMLVVQIQLKLNLQDDLFNRENEISTIDNSNLSIDYDNNLKTRYIDVNNNWNNSFTYLKSTSFMKMNQLEDDRVYVLTDNIRSSSTETILTIIIDDINDNKPIFVYPPPASDNQFFIGYPDIELSNTIPPDYLLQVFATDLDIGINALIRYKLINSDFGIDEITGKIFPYSNAMKQSEEIKLIVYAIDRDGHEEGSLSSSVEIYVKKINSNQLVILEFKATEIVNVEELLEKTSENKGFKLRALKWAIVLDKDDIEKSLLLKMAENLSKFFRAADQTDREMILRVWAYGFGEKNEIVESDIIIGKLSQHSEIKAEQYKNQQQQNVITETQNIVGYIVGIVILSIICLACIGFITWLFYYRKISYNKLSSPSRSDISSFAPSSSEQSSTIEKGPDSPPQISSYLKRESMKISGITTHETSDYQTRMLERLNDKEIIDRRNNGSNNSSNDNYNNDSIDDDDDDNDENIMRYRSGENHQNNIPNGDIGERRKSMVTFNELVERIEIEDRRDSEISDINSERL